MISDNINGAKRYYPLGDRFERAFGFIKRACEEKLPEGRYDIDEGGTLYAFVQGYDTKLPEAAKPEAHRKYIDIQYIISGVEKIEVFDIGIASVTEEYDSERDIEFFSPIEDASSLILRDGDWGIFFPNDVHRPGMTYKEKCAIRKIVVKIAV